MATACKAELDRFAMLADVFTQAFCTASLTFSGRRASMTYQDCEAFDKKTLVDNVRGDVDFELGRWVIRQNDLRVCFSCV